MRSAIFESPARSASRAIRSAPRCRASAFGSTSSTAYPPRAATKAIPAPIVPPPATNTKSSISHGLFAGIGRSALPMQKPQWQRRSSKYLIDSPFMRLRADEVELPDGTVIAEYYVREARGFVVVFATTPDDRIVLVRQYRYGSDEIHLELPAGMLDGDEDPGDCAARELLEETGYETTSWEKVADYFVEPVRSKAK